VSLCLSTVYVCIVCSESWTDWQTTAAEALRSLEEKDVQRLAFATLGTTCFQSEEPHVVVQVRARARRRRRRTCLHFVACNCCGIVVKVGGRMRAARVHVGVHVAPYSLSRSFWEAK